MRFEISSFNYLPLTLSKTIKLTWSLSKEGNEERGESGGAISKNTVYSIMLSATVRWKIVFMNACAPGTYLLNEGNILRWIQFFLVPSIMALSRSPSVSMRDGLRVWFVRWFIGQILIFCGGTFSWEERLCKTSLSVSCFFTRTSWYEWATFSASYKSLP